MTGEIVSLIEEVTKLDLTGIVKWHPMTDYLGNHMLSSWKFKNAGSGWKPKIDLATGIMMSFQSIMKAEGYNPLKYLEQAKSNNNQLNRVLLMSKKKKLDKKGDSGVDLLDKDAVKRTLAKTL